MIVETNLLETNRCGECNSIYDAIALSLKEGRNERVAGLFEAAHGRPAWKNRFGWFVGGFFIRHPPEKDSVPLKRFITLHGEELGKKNPAIFESICEELVWKLNLGLTIETRRNYDRLGWTTLLDNTQVFTIGFLSGANDEDRANFIKYGYREAIEEGLKEEYMIRRCILVGSDGERVSKSVFWRVS